MKGSEMIVFCIILLFVGCLQQSRALLTPTSPSNQIARDSMFQRLYSSSFNHGNLPEADAIAIQAAGGPKADTYGEMTLRGLFQWNNAYPFAGDGSFLDLGSGRGSLVVQSLQELEMTHAMGIELSQARHDEAMAMVPEELLQQQRLQFVCGDAAGEAAAPLLERASVVWCSNLLFNDALQARIVSAIVNYGRPQMVASLKEFPGGIPGMELQPFKLPLEMSWTAGKELPGHPPLPGHPCAIYIRSHEIGVN